MEWNLRKVELAADLRIGSASMWNVIGVEGKHTGEDVLLIV